LTGINFRYRTLIATAPGSSRASQRLQEFDQIGFVGACEMEPKPLVAVIDDREEIGRASIVKIRRDFLARCCEGSVRWRTQGAKNYLRAGTGPAS